MRMREKVAARDEADEPLGGGGDANATPAGVSGLVPEELALITLMANFCPLEQCCGKVQMK